MHPLGIGLAELFGDHPHRRARLAEVHARLEARGREEVVALVGAVGIGLQRQPGIGGRIGFEILLHDTDHGERPFVQQDGSSHDVRVAAEAALPDAVGENRGAWPAGQVLGAVENPAQRWHSAKDLKELTGDMQGLELNGRISAAERLVEPPWSYSAVAANTSLLRHAMYLGMVTAPLWPPPG